jgi:hypothetical protein
LRAEAAAEAGVSHTKARAEASLSEVTRAREADRGRRRPAHDVRGVPLAATRDREAEASREAERRAKARADAKARAALQSAAEARLRAALAEPPLLVESLTVDEAPVQATARHVTRTSAPRPRAPSSRLCSTHAALAG